MMAMATPRPNCDRCGNRYADGEKARLFVGQPEGWSYCDSCYRDMPESEKLWYCEATHLNISSEGEEKS